MPSLSMYKISAPTDPKEFENLLLDFAAVRYKGNATLLGRQGQKQHGVDVVVTRGDYSLVCVQCKDVKQSSVNIDSVDKWIREAESSPVPMKLFVIAVAAERDTKVQEHVFQVFDKRVAAGQFPVEIVFWDDIEHFIKSNDIILKNYYPYLYQEKKNAVSVGMTPITDKYTDLLKSENELRTTFLNEVVKYHIQEMMAVDVFIGFPTELVMNSDAFELSIQQLMYRSIAIEGTDRHMQIKDFMRAFYEFTSYLSTIGEYVNEKMIRVVNQQVWNEIDTYKATIEILRKSVYSYLEEIKSC